MIDYLSDAIFLRYFRIPTVPFDPFKLGSQAPSPHPTTFLQQMYTFVTTEIALF